MDEELEKARDNIINTALGWSHDKGDSTMDRFEWKLYDAISEYHRVCSKKVPF